MKPLRYMLDRTMANDLARPGYYVMDTADVLDPIIAVFLEEKNADNYIEWLNDNYIEWDQ